MYMMGEREMVLCPYNRYHVVSKLRIQKHLVKCQKNYPNVQLATCFYNYSHRVKPKDMLNHYKTCRHKTRLEDSRFYEPRNLHDSHSLENRNPYTKEFPQIDAKPQFFTNSAKFSSISKPRVRDVGNKFNSCSESEREYLSKPGKSDIKTDFSSDDNGLDLVPLPLPKTVSKAFVCAYQSANKLTSQTSSCKSFGRGKNFLPFSPTKPSRTSDHFLSDSIASENERKNRNEESKFFSKSITAPLTPSEWEFDYVLKSELKSSLNSSSTLITASMLDDNISLKSEEIIFDEDGSEKDENGESVIIKNFNNFKI